MTDTAIPAKAPQPGAVPSTKPLWLVLMSACVIVALAMGLRQVMGFYMIPVTGELKIGREVFSLAMAIANIVWGMGAPFAGAIGDKFGTGRVVMAGALMTMTGLLLMYAAQGEAMLLLSGLFLGLGVAGTGVTVLVGAAARAAPPEKRTSAIATIGMGSGLGVLLAVPYTHLLIEAFGWKQSLVIIAATALVMVPLATALGGGAVQAAGTKPQTLKEALSEAFAHPSFWLLVAGFFVCGFHVSFYAVHLPAYVADKGLPPSIAVQALIVVGIGNIIGTWLAGKSAAFVPKRFGLCFIYIGRALIFLGILYVPTTEWTVLLFSAALGLLWLSTVPLTSSLVATFFGPVWMSMLFGIVFFSHQVGSFLGVWIAGRVFDMTRSYDLVWWISIGLGLFAALVHFPIKEKPVARLQAKAA